MTTNKKRFLLICCCIGIAGFNVPDVLAQGAKVDVCHVPPGNPDNAHTITISENALGAHLDHGDHVGACDTEPAVEVREPGDPTRSACICPKPGVWRVTNHEGYMECNILGIRRKDTRPDKNDGAIWILNDDCSTFFGEAYERNREDMLMDRGRDCLFFGFYPGEEDGNEVIFDMAAKVETEEFITGESYMDMSAMGMKCTGYSPFQIDFLEPLSEKKYAKLEEKMQERLEIVREEIEEHREQIDEYLKETDGGKSLGGMNGQE